MKALVLSKFGDEFNFGMESTVMPHVKDNEVLIKNMAFDINPIDIKTRKGNGVASAYVGDKPMILGWGCAGKVVETGKDVRGFKVGDNVFGVINFPGRGGCYAQYVAAPVDQIALMPDNISYSLAAASTLAALTAWQALVDTAGIKSGDKVLIHGGAGGVGSFAIQIAKSKGAFVSTTASGEGVEYVRQIGADQVFDYKKDNFEDSWHLYDIILDTIGGENFEKSVKVLEPDGRIILLPSDKLEQASGFVRENGIRNFSHIVVQSDGREMAEIAGMLEKGQIIPHIHHTFPFECISQAHQMLEMDHVIGKIVVEVN